MTRINLGRRGDRRTTLKLGGSTKKCKEDGKATLIMGLDGDSLGHYKESSQPS